MHRTDSYFRRNPGGSSLRRFSFRRKPTKEFIPVPTSTWTFNDESHEWQLLREDGAHIQLVYNKTEHIPLKDFAAEIRGGKDIKEFILSALVLLDVQDTSIGDLLEMILRQIKQTNIPHNGGGTTSPTLSVSNATTTMISNTVGSMSGHRENLNVEEIKQALFVNDRVRILAKTLQATTATETNWTYDQSWLAIMCTSPSILKRHVAIARLKNPCNLGRNCQEARFIVFILSPMKEKGTKNFLETGRTFATIFADIELRAKLLKAATQQEFISIIDKHTDHLMEQQTAVTRTSLPDPFDDINTNAETSKDQIYYCPLPSDICLDLSRRLPHYFSDYYDIFKTDRGPQKVLSTAVFLYFACLLPSIAFGVLNSQATKNEISVPKAIASQCLGGIFFSIFAGQPLIVVMTTAPLTLYVKEFSIEKLVIYALCAMYQVDFRSTYALVGLWNSFFLILYAIFGVSKVMKWSTRSTEEIFALFVSIAFVVDASSHVYKNFSSTYSTVVCKQHDEYWGKRKHNTSTIINVTEEFLQEPCSRDSSLLYLLLTLGTVWLGTFLYKFKQTPYLTSAKRELLTDYALPVSVIIMSLVGSILFSQIKLPSFGVDSLHLFDMVQFKSVNMKQIIGTGVLGFSLSLLMFLDQNIAGAIVNSPANKLKKGKAFHVDLFVIAILNGWLSLFGLTWMHGALPLSPLHVKALADTEERVEQGHIQSVIVKVRETRLTVLISHIFIGMSLLMHRVLTQIPMPVLDGLFLYLALTSLDGNQFFERVTLFFTEQAAYPPNHYIRQVPQRKIHLFTFLQLIQLLILCILGFLPILYTKLILPIWLVFMVGFRYRILPKIIATKYLRALDQRL
ncbi:unnamed protein product [Adineta steineri]|uniref:Bicarbonate transporter-like transmembrane domain-containing protein n=1 Tax=Adineta steineri TaxID=433720 RepID=A0A814Z2M1_9BILA|nr:unnamed protein product [Adineta steineri]